MRRVSVLIALIASLALVAASCGDDPSGLPDAAGPGAGAPAGNDATAVPPVDDPVDDPIDDAVNSDEPGVDDPVSSDDPVATEPDTTGWVRGPAFLSSADVLLLESYPVQVRLVVRGDLPTPCAVPRYDVAEPDEDGRIAVEVYSLTDPELFCAQVLEPFELSIPVGNFTDGAFVIVVDGAEYPFSL